MKNYYIVYIDNEKETIQEGEYKTKDEAEDICLGFNERDFDADGYYEVRS